MVTNEQNSPPPPPSLPLTSIKMKYYDLDVYCCAKRKSSWTCDIVDDTKLRNSPAVAFASFDDIFLQLRKFFFNL